MKKICLVLLAVVASPVFAGDLWEVVSTSVGPDGKPTPFTQTSCFPKDGMDPASMLGNMGSCTFDQKSGNASAMNFVMTCRTPGMPAELGSMKVAGDARLGTSTFDMRYTITVGGNQALAGGDFKMTGSATGKKVGQCTER